MLPLKNEFASARTVCTSIEEANILHEQLQSKFRSQGHSYLNPAEWITSVRYSQILMPSLDRLENYFRISSSNKFTLTASLAELSKPNVGKLIKDMTYPSELKLSFLESPFTKLDCGDGFGSFGLSVKNSIRGKSIGFTIEITIGCYRAPDKIKFFCEEFADLVDKTQLSKLVSLEPIENFAKGFRLNQKCPDVVASVRDFSKGGKAFTLRFIFPDKAAATSLMEELVEANGLFPSPWMFKIKPKIKQFDNSVASLKKISPLLSLNADFRYQNEFDPLRTWQESHESDSSIVPLPIFLAYSDDKDYSVVVSLIHQADGSYFEYVSNGGRSYLNRFIDTLAVSNIEIWENDFSNRWERRHAC